MRRTDSDVRDGFKERIGAGGDTRRAVLARYLLPLVALVGSFLLVALDLGLENYGTTFDEVCYHESSRLQMRWLETIGQRGSFSEDTLLRYFQWMPHVVVHPTFSRWCSGIGWLIFHRWFGVNEIVALRLHNAIAFAGIAWGIVGFVLSRYGVTAALVALSLVWGDVRLFGHTHTAETDMTLAFLWLSAALLGMRGIYARSSWSWGGAALLAGAALATKLTGLLLVGLLAVWPVWVHGWRGLRMAATLLGIPLLVFYVLDPLTWHHPIAWTANWLVDFGTREQRMVIPSLFFGETYMFRAPWYAATVNGLITIPPAILALAGVAAASITRQLYRAEWRRRWQALRSPWAMLAAAGVTPLIACSLPGVPNHDMERLFLPMQPLLVLASAHGFHVLSSSGWFSRLFQRSVRLSANLRNGALAGLVALPTLVSAARFHPYELTYFNFLVGGPRGAQKLGFDVAYFGQEFNQQALDAVNRLVAPGAEVWTNKLQFDFLRHQETGLIRPDIRLSRALPARYVLIHGRRSWFVPFEKWLMDHPERATWILEHHGVVLMALYEMEDAPSR